MSGSRKSLANAKKKVKKVPLGKKLSSHSFTVRGESKALTANRKNMADIMSGKY